MDWSSIERAADVQAQAFARPILSTPVPSAPMLVEHSLTARSLPSKPFLGFKEGSSLLGKENFLFLTNSATPLRTSSGGVGGGLGESTLPYPPADPSVSSAAPKSISAPPPAAPSSSSNSTWSRGLDTLLGSEMAELRRLLHTQNCRLEALEGQNEHLRVGYSQSKHILDDLYEKYTSLDSAHRKALQQLDSLATQNEALHSLQRKQESRLSQLEDQQAAQQSISVRKDQFQQTMDVLLEQLHSAHSITSSLSQRSTETTSMLESIINAWLDLSSSSPSSAESANKLQVALIQSPSSELYKSNIKVLLTESLQHCIHNSIQAHVQSEEEKLQSTLLVCIQDMRQHCDFLLRPALEGQSHVASQLHKLHVELQQLKLGLHINSPAIVNSSVLGMGSTGVSGVPSPYSSLLEEKLLAIEPFRKLQAQCQRLEEEVLSMQNNLASNIVPQVTQCSALAEKHAQTSDQALEIVKVRLEQQNEQWRMLQGNTSSLEVIVETLKKDILLVRNELDTDYFVNANKMVREFPMQMSSLQADFVAFKSSVDLSVSNSVQALHKDIHGHQLEVTRQLAQWTALLEDHKTYIQQQVKPLQDQVIECSANMSPLQANYDAVHNQTKQIMEDMTTLSQDTQSKYERLLKERQENKVYLEEREQHFHELLLEKYNQLEAHYQSWHQNMERMLQEVQQSNDNGVVMGKVRSLEEKISQWTGLLTDFKESSMQMTSKVDHLDINLRKEMDKWKAEWNRTGAEWQEKSASMHRQHGSQWQELSEALRQASTKMKMEMDTLRSECHKQGLEGSDFQSALGKLAVQIAALEKKSEEDWSQFKLLLGEETQAWERSIKEQKEEIRLKWNAMESLWSKAHQASLENYQQVFQQTTNLDLQWKARMDSELSKWRDNLSEHFQSELQATNQAIQSSMKQELEQVNTNLQIVLSQQYQFTTLLDSLEGNLNSQNGDLLKAKESLLLEILSDREAMSNRLQSMYKTLAESLEEMKYDITQVQNKYQLLDVYVDTPGIFSRGGGGGGGGGGGDRSSASQPSEPISSSSGQTVSAASTSSHPSPPSTDPAVFLALKLRLDQLEQIVHENHKTLPTYLQEYAAKYFMDRGSSTATLEEIQKIYSARMNAFQSAMEILQQQMRGWESKWNGHKLLNAPNVEDYLQSQVSSHVKENISSGFQALWDIKMVDLEQVFVSNAQYLPAVEKIHKGMVSYQALLDSLQDEVVELGTQLEQWSKRQDQLREQSTQTVAASPQRPTTSSSASEAAAKVSLQPSLHAKPSAQAEAKVSAKPLSTSTPETKPAAHSSTIGAEKPVDVSKLSSPPTPVPPAADPSIGTSTARTADTSSTEPIYVEPPSLEKLAAQMQASTKPAASLSSATSSVSSPPRAQAKMSTKPEENPDDGQLLHVGSSSFDPDSPNRVPTSPIRSVELTSPARAAPDVLPLSPNSFDDEDESEEDEEIDEEEDEEEGEEASDAGHSLSQLDESREGFDAAEVVKAQGFAMDAPHDHFAGHVGASPARALSSKRVDYMLKGIGTLPDGDASPTIAQTRDQWPVERSEEGEESMDSHDLEEDFQRIKEYVQSSPGNGPKNANQLEDELERERDAEDEEEDDENDFVSSDSDSNGPEKDDDEEEEEEEEEYDRSLDQDDAPTPIYPPSGPLAPLPLPSVRSSGAALSPLRPGQTSISGPTLAHLPSSISRGSGGMLSGSFATSSSTAPSSSIGGLSSAPVLSGSLLTRSRLGLPPSSQSK